jgi:hypothetical protein
MKPNVRKSVLVSIAGLVAAAVAASSADAAAYLSVPVAKARILSFQKQALHGDKTVRSVQVSNCKRISSSRVSCQTRVNQTDGIYCLTPMTAYYTSIGFLMVNPGNVVCHSNAVPPPPPAPPIPPVGGGHSGGYYYGTGSGHWIQSKNLTSSVITLEDGSIWQVAPYDSYKALTWLVVDDITVVENSDPLYPYTLIDTNDGSSVHAKYLR